MTDEDGVIPDAGVGPTVNEDVFAYSNRIRQDDGTITVQKFVPDSDAEVIDRDVRAYFPDAASINKALRALIGIMPQKQRKISAAN